MTQFIAKCAVPVQVKVTGPILVQKLPVIVDGGGFDVRVKEAWQPAEYNKCPHYMEGTALHADSDTKYGHSDLWNYFSCMHI